MTTTPACPKCGFTHNCICDQCPTLQSQAHFVLLQHPNEQHKDTNTGKLMQHSLPHCEQYTWNRVEPPQALLDLIANKNYQPWVVFPHDEAITGEQFRAQTTPRDGNIQPLFILLDATWQEAKKMLRKSKWLNNLPCLVLTNTAPSSYQLRRNQQEGNLCTCEVGIELLNLLGQSQDAEQLHTYFTHFISVFHADKSGHRYQK
ncbi:DTW domain-containing protein [Vibrio sp. Of7-15]|uniref:tRNA-uridine aminocarboxypropyltransferase n=1 Tax=Vibrio sp. Of7-15 TaxID=2724879 RepID=UPI001EF2C627|nr:DTW domain-containing protein [Vibrio sp. Of7-15]MCG7498889.1 DTW domain-containing protein [Vibrio sp. Of7-15]